MPQFRQITSAVKLKWVSGISKLETLPRLVEFVKISTSHVLNAPVYSETIVVPLLSSNHTLGAIIYSPVSVGLQPGLITTNSALRAPAYSAGAVEITTTLITTSFTLYDPLVGSDIIDHVKISTGHTLRAPEIFETTVSFTGSKLTTNNALAAPVFEETATGPSYEIFTADGTWNWASAGSPDHVDVLVVAGGGGGGSWRGGGGGAGGVIAFDGIPVGGNIAVTVGAGGAGSPGGATDPPPAAVSGGNSLFGSLIEAAGGGFGGRGSNSNNLAGNGGSGGGEGGANTASALATGVSGQGSDGGRSTNGGVTERVGGGGGGKAEVGVNATTTVPGNGGDGITLASIGWDDAIAEGAPSAIGGGGGGASNDTGETGGSGGLGGGGAGNSNGNGTAGTANTGGGGGAAGGGAFSTNAGAAGGSGIVIVRYPSISQAYRFFRLDILATATGAQNFTGTKELEIRESIGGANALTGLTKTITASDFDVSGPPEDAFDDSYADINGWATPWSDGTPLEWIQCELDLADAITPVEIAIGGYFSTTNQEERSIGEFKLYVSHDGATWIEIAHELGITWAGHDFSTPKVFAI